MLWHVRLDAEQPIAGSRASRRIRKSGKLATASVGKYRAEDLAFLVDLVESGDYQAVRDQTFDLSDITAAHRFVDSGHKKGNVVLRLV